MSPLPSQERADAVAVHGALGAAQLEIQRLEAVLAERDVTIGRVRALLDGANVPIEGALWAVRGVREADLRAALEDPS